VKPSYRKTTFDNGLRILTERVPHVKSVSVGIWVNIGSRDENESEAGLSHFIEHMIFKGTARRDALQIAKEIDQIGGMANAFTSKEYTCFHARVMSDHLPLATDLLIDIFLHSVFDFEDIDRERQVILQEINMVEDTPDEHIHVLFGQNFWPGAPLGRPVLGTVETISRAGREEIYQYLKRHYLPTKIIIAAVGNLEHKAFVDLIGPSLEAMPAVEDNLVRQPPEVKTDVTITAKELEQVHFCLGSPFPTAVDERRYAAAMLSTILGGNMSSRLFQEIRENRGLAYSIYSFLSTYIDAGLLGIYAGIGQKQVNEVIRLILAELKKLRMGEIKDSELKAAREYLKGGIALNLESTDNLMTRLARNEVTYHRNVSYEEIVTSINRVAKDQIVGLAEEYFQPQSLALTVLGSVSENELQPDILNQ